MKNKEKVEVQGILERTKELMGGVGLNPHFVMKVGLLLVKRNYNPLAYRYYVLNSHYRKQLAFSFESLEMASVAY